MLGMTYDELCELLKYIEVNNSWLNMYDICSKNPKRRIVKYVRFSMDTRESDVWNVTFDNIIGGYGGKDPVTFRTEMGYSLKERVYKWLNEEEE